MSVKRPPRPAGLGVEGARLWREIVAEMAEDGLVPSAQERRWLADACREADIVARFDAALAGAPLVTKGSMGQEVESPLSVACRQHRTVLASLLARVSVAETQTANGSGSRTTSTQARAAAMARHGAVS